MTITVARLLLEDRVRPGSDEAVHYPIGPGRRLAAAVGVAALAMLSTLLDLGGVISFWQDIVTGCLLPGAVGLDVVRRGAEFL